MSKLTENLDGFHEKDFFFSYQAVENMRNGMTPTKAAENAILRISKYYPEFSGAIVAANIDGEYGLYLRNRKWARVYIA